MKTLILTIGLPQSGKSTWVRQQPHPIVNPDSIRLALHGKPFIAEAEGFVWAIAKCMVQALFLAGHDTVIVDATNTTKARRDAWKSSKWSRSYKVFLGQPEVCKERARLTATDDEHFVGLCGAIDRMIAQWEAVSQDEEMTEIQ